MTIENGDKKEWDDRYPKSIDDCSPAEWDAVRDKASDRSSSFFEPCKCRDKYTIEQHGDGYALFFGRCRHKHGYNYMRITEVAFNAPSFEFLESALNATLND